MAAIILHVDMDAFFAAIEQRDRPCLRGRPVIVGGDPDARGVVAGASYEAREYGVHSAMSTRAARRLCPRAVFLRPRIAHYQAVAARIREILQAYTPLVEPLSLDEAFLDLTATVPAYPSPRVLAEEVKAKVVAAVGLTASLGVAPNKFLAKLAGDLGKPDGLVVVGPGEVRALLDPLPVSRLWGVGAKTEEKLHALGLRTIGQVAAVAPEALTARFGPAGRHLWLLARGEDDRRVVPDREAKSVSTETTFPADVGDREVLRAWLLDLVEDLARRLRALGVRGRTLELKVRTAGFQTHSRSATLATPTDVTAALWQAAADLFDGKVSDDWLPVRLLGVGVTGLVREGEGQGELFDAEWQAKQRALDRVQDAIRQRFGTDALRRAGGHRRTGTDD